MWKFQQARNIDQIKCWFNVVSVTTLGRHRINVSCLFIFAGISFVVFWYIPGAWFKPLLLWWFVAWYYNSGVFMWYSCHCNLKISLDLPHRETQHLFLYNKLQTLLIHILLNMTILNIGDGFNVYPANTRHSLNVGLMFGRRRRRRVNINPTLGQRLVFAGYPCSVNTAYPVNWYVKCSSNRTI